MGFAEFQRHGQFIIQVGKAAVRVKSACVQNRLRGLFNFGFLLFGWCRPREVVVNNILGQTIANTVLTSDNAVIAAPQGVVVVAVEGEKAVKAVVK